MQIVKITLLEKGLKLQQLSKHKIDSTKYGRYLPYVEAADVVISEEAKAALQSKCEASTTKKQGLIISERVIAWAQPSNEINVFFEDIYFDKKANIWLEKCETFKQ